MIILNNSKSIVGTQLAVQRNEKLDKDGNEKAQVPRLGAFVKLAPGTNDVSPATWDALQKQKSIKRLIEDGTLEEHGSPASKAAVVSTLAGYTVPEAIKLIKATTDTEKLDAWGMSDERAGVLKAIEAQQDALSLKADEDAGDEDDDETK